MPLTFRLCCKLAGKCRLGADALNPLSFTEVCSFLEYICLTFSFVLKCLARELERLHSWKVIHFVIYFLFCLFIILYNSGYVSVWRHVRPAVITVLCCQISLNYFMFHSYKFRYILGDSRCYSKIGGILSYLIVLYSFERRKVGLWYSIVSRAGYIIKLDPSGAFPCNRSTFISIVSSTRTP